MPRKEILIAGFRHVRLVSKHLKQRKGAQLYGYATGKLHGALPAKARAYASKSAAVKQPGAVGAQRGGTGGRDAAGPPSFAASAAGPAPAAAGAATSGLFSGFSLKAAAAALGRRAGGQDSPSFASAPLWGSRGAEAAAPPAPAPSAAAQAVAGPAAKKKQGQQVPASVASNPLYRLSKLAGGSTPPPAAAAQPEVEAAALGRYAKLGAKPATSAGEAAAKKLGSVASLLRYAKLAK